MNLRDYLLEVANTYDRHAGLGTATQEMLRGAAGYLDPYPTGNWQVRGSGGIGRATFTPWFGFFDPDETLSPQEGLFVVYLFSADLHRVYLTVLQGITALSRRLGNDAAARLELERVGADLRRRLTSEVSDLLITMDLRATGVLQLGYSAGCVVAKKYDTHALPADTALEEDLLRMLAICGEAIDLRRRQS